jgi:hypothetical protein
MNKDVGHRKQIKKVHLTKRYARYRIMSPSLFEKSSFKTHDIGRKGHSKRITGILKSDGKWATQSVLVAREDYEKGVRVKIKYGRPVIVGD